MAKYEDRKGERNKNSRLVEADVRAIRERHAAGESYSALADAYAVDQSHIGWIVKRKRWAHVK